ncbi:beta-propeller domain-containing protein [Nonomuraea sp. NBC_01738]|uniref:beta-propeller domain-containing protein n=1 Tax=Nonomuraea sp. NBC_01738 TaxID=2976003 RepID=UPI002E14E208|nr:beta-propeller domain-containing protein [Nonomuraea sp. NBC_01738]
MKTLIRTALTAAALATATAACTSAAGQAPPKLDLSRDVRLVAYSGCDDMLAGLREHAAKNVGAWGFGGGITPYMARDLAESTPQQSTAKADTGGAVEHSTTNVNEAGVDEPDLVKTDGNRVFTVAGGKLRVIDTATKKVTGLLNLVDKDNPAYMPADLLISGDRVLVMFRGGMMFKGFAPGGQTKYLLVDVSGGEPKVLSTIKPQGEHVDARLVGSTVRLVTRSQPDITFPQAKDNVPEQERIKVNQGVVRQAPIEAWLPKIEITDGDGTTRKDAVKCERVSHPDDYSGTSLLTVHSIDLGQGITAAGTDPISLAADGDTVYGTGQSLYVASNPRWFFPVPVDVTVMEDAPKGTPSASGDAPADEPTASEPAVPPASPSEPPVPPEETEVHRFDISQAGAPRYAASGKVPGRLLNQYSLSEFEGNLRVATTLATAKTSSSSVYVLKADTLGKVGEVGGLGEGERIYSVRFIGPVGYVVTFKQVDPLYTLDLRDPAAPKVTGELKITGYSAYLHPAGDGRLIGLGQEASEKGRTLGTQLSLFDVSNPAAPQRLSQFFQKESGSEAEWDPHAFLYWPKTGLTVLPLTAYQEAGSGALVLKVDQAGITKLGMIKHPKQTQQGYTYQPGIQRSMVIGDALWTVSYNGIQVNDATSLDKQAWIPLT